MEGFYAWLAASAVSKFMTGWQWAWPWAEAFHYVGMSLLFGAVLLMDVRLMGFFRSNISLHSIHSLTPWALGAFLINLITGVAFISTRAKSYVDNASFDFKMICLFFASVNFLIFWFVVREQVSKLADDADTGLLAKSVGFSSILLWSLVIWGGRLIPVYGMG